jgi:glycosyltransferase involved in cell wall biosynthesis
MRSASLLKKSLLPSPSFPAETRRPCRLLCLITSLEVGGAQMMLYNLLSGMDRKRFTIQVITLIGNGAMGEKIQSLGIPVRSLGMRRGIPSPVGALRLARWLRQDRPNVIHTWMYHADLIGALAAKLVGDPSVVWGIHQGDLSPENNKRLTLQTVKACACISRWLPDQIVCCSEASRRTHIAVGYAAEKMVVIPNGSDLAAFRSDSIARESVRKELEIAEEGLIIGLVGRFHQQKDHRNFVRAAALLHCDKPDVHFLLCGDDVTWDNTQLARSIQEAGIWKRCHLLGRRDDIPRLTAALDLATSSSCYGEAFPMVIGEAMGCGVPCVVTDVGDSARIVGETGRVVPPRNPLALASAWRELIELGREERRQLGRAARHRIEKYFDLSDIVMLYQDLYQKLAGMATR